MPNPVLGSFQVAEPKSNLREAGPRIQSQVYRVEEIRRKPVRIFNLMLRRPADWFARPIAEPGLRPETVAALRQPST